MTATIAHEMASPFVGGATDQLMTKSLDAKRASADFKNAPPSGDGSARTAASAFATTW